MLLNEMLNIKYPVFQGAMANISNGEFAAMDKFVEGFADPANLLYGPEIKFYSNGLVLDETFQTSIENLYSIGDGGGLTTGLMMASCSGVQLARIFCK